MKQVEDRVETLLCAAIELRYMAGDNPRFGPVSNALARALEDIAQTERGKSASGAGIRRPAAAGKPPIAVILKYPSPQSALDRSG